MLGALLLAALAGCAASPGEEDGGTRDVFAPATGLRLEKVLTGLHDPVYLTAPAGDPRLFIVEQAGLVRIARDGKLLDRPFLDLTKRVKTGTERGLLSLAFHPRYAENGFLFVNYTDRSGDTRIERYRVTADPDVADPSSAKLILAVDQPYSNHNGGHVLFGPDGMFYVGMGDGGSANDPHDHGQNTATLLGDLLRIDVDRGDPFAIPPDNPLVGRRGARPEIWAYGLRNPWRLTFDAPAGLLYIADVGQDRWEEVNVAPAGSAGLNYGWNILEGRHDFRVRGRSKADLVAPAVEYPHRDGCSVTGGYVYRGRNIPAVVGHYFFSDYCTGWIRSFRYQEGKATDLRQWTGLTPSEVTSFGVDGAGELYVLSGRGEVHRLASAR